MDLRSRRSRVWHWDLYVEKMDLWRHFARFAKAIEGIDPAAERFRPVVIERPGLRILALKGRTTLLAWGRDSQNTLPRPWRRPAGSIPVPAQPPIG